MLRALILADGDVPSRAVLDGAWPGWDADVDLVIAADGGARHGPGLGVRIDHWVGDGDSLGEAAIAELAAAGVPIERSPPDKDESDTELAIRAAVRLGADDLVILGALGGARIDHALANIGLLGVSELGDRRAVILDGRSRLSLLRTTDRQGDPVSASLVGRIGDLVSLLPVGDGVKGVTTSGLLYPLTDEPLLAGTPRGLSNVIVRSGAQVRLRAGRLLVIETPATFPA